MLSSSPVTMFRRSPSDSRLFGSSPPGSSPAFSLLGSSPPSGSPGILGSSPPNSARERQKSEAHAAAKKWWKRLRYDSSLSPSEFTVGFVDSTQQPERKSGAGAWSLRVQNFLVDIPYTDFIERFSDEYIPFHRIACFKHHGAVIWESEHHRKLYAEAHAPEVLGSKRASPTTGGPGISSSPAVQSPAAEPAAEPSDPEPEPPSFADLPEEAWFKVLKHLIVRDLCMISKVNRFLRKLVAAQELWQLRYRRIFGQEPVEDWNCATLKRMCRRSELKAARWLDGEVTESPLGFPNTLALQLDDTKALTADGSAVRLLDHRTGRRIATLQGHTGRVTCVAFDDEYILSGCTATTVKLWGMDDLKSRRTLRGHSAAISSCALFNHMPITASDDGTLILWDAAHGSPIEVLDTEDPIHALDVQAATGYMTTAGWSVDIWDVGTAQKLHALSVEEEAWDVQFSERSPSHPFTSVSGCGAVVAAGRAGQVLLWDTRTTGLLGSIEQRGTGEQPPGCAGVQLDDWKLATTFADGSNCLQVHDIRACGGPLCDGGWREPLHILAAPARITCFAFHGQTILSGLEGQECVLWTYGAPTGAGQNPSGCAEPLGDMLGAGGQGRKDRKKGLPKPSGKKENRYPKRKTK